MVSTLPPPDPLRPLGRARVFAHRAHAEAMDISVGKSSFGEKRTPRPGFQFFDQIVVVDDDIFHGSPLTAATRWIIARDLDGTAIPNTLYRFAGGCFNHASAITVEGTVRLEIANSLDEESLFAGEGAGRQLCEQQAPFSTDVQFGVNVFESHVFVAARADDFYVRNRLESRVDFS